MSESTSPVSHTAERLLSGPVALTRPETARLAVVVGAWFALYVWRALVGHWSLGTSAYDLSVFDYALWSLGHAGNGHVPFLGHSIFSYHFMPILVVLAPVYALFGSAAKLLVLQLAAVAFAAVALYWLCRRMTLEAWSALALTAVFLWSRRTHSAAAGYFYPESLQTGLTFAVVGLWSARARAFWPAAILLLMTKEDASVYLGAFALVASLQHPAFRRRALALLGVSVAWLAIALFLAIPASRSADGLPPANPLMQTRYGGAGGDVEAGLLIDRVVSVRSARTVANLVVTTGLLPLGGLTWVAPALPGLAANMAAAPGSAQSTLIDHYAWPVLPWLFLAAAAGAVRLQRRSTRLVRIWLAVLVVATMVDNPALRQPGGRLPDAAEAAVARAQLAQVEGTIVLAQANLIPHLRHQMNVFAVGGDVQPPAEADLVLLTTLGNLWPLTVDETTALVRTYQADVRYEQVSAGPLYAFRRR